jgi:lipopolysaccharide export system protein LptA
MKRALIAILALSACGAAAAAQQRPSAVPQGQPQLAVPQTSRPGPLANLGSGNKEPIKIDADRLDVFDKEQRAVFSGNVVAVQGESTVHCTELTVLYDQQRGQGQGSGARAAAPASSGVPGQDGAIKRIDCKGPVTVVSKTQTATGDNAVFDRSANRVVLTGNVALSDGPNVTRGDKIVYDMNTGVANVETTTGGRVRALFVPGSAPEGVQGGNPAPAQSSSQAQPPRQPGRRPVQTN